MKTPNVPTHPILIASAFSGKNTDTLSLDDWLTCIKNGRTQLRIAAAQHMQSAFRETIDDHPFCLVNTQGSLIPYQRTHPIFAQWASCDRAPHSTNTVTSDTSDLTKHAAPPQDM